MRGSPSPYGEWLTNARASLGWSTEQLATMAGLSSMTVDQIEQGGIQNPDLSVRRKVETAIQSGAIAAQRRAAGEAVPETETMIRAYDNLGRMNSDAALLSQQGWTILAQSESKQGRGCLTLFAAPRITRTVTYQRTITSGHAEQSHGQ